MSIKWYKISQEFIGAGEPISGNVQQQPEINALEEKDGGTSDQAYRDPSGNGKDSPISKPKISCTDMHTGKIITEGDKCPNHCGSDVEKGDFNDNQNGTYTYVCRNPQCKYSSYDSGWDIKVKRKSRIKHKRSSSISPFVEAAMPATPYNNIANKPYGNLDVSDDVRVIPWDKIEPDYRETWDSQKQKKKLNYKIKKVKDNEGKIKFIKVKDPASGSGVQPANTYTQKGDIKRQERYKDDYDKNRNSQGAWPHNRSPGPEDGWYGSDSVVDKNKFNADMRTRVQLWSEYVTERDTQFGGFTKPS